MKRRQFAVATLLALTSLTLVLIPASKLAGSYDPWLDYNDDGMIDAHDLHPLGQAYGSSGDPTKNVNVTNWPVQRELFPEDLVLRGAVYSAGASSGSWMRRELYDATTAPSPAFRSAYDYVSATLDTTSTLVYNHTYIYQKIPTSAYQILGMPLVSSTWNVSNSPSVTLFYLNFEVYLGKISMNEEWTQLTYLGQVWDIYYGTNFNYQAVYTFTPITPITIMLNAYERLAIRILVYGFTTIGGETTKLFLMLLVGTNTDYFIVDVPIVENPPYTP